MRLGSKVRCSMPGRALVQVVSSLYKYTIGFYFVCNWECRWRYVLGSVGSHTLTEQRRFTCSWVKGFRNIHCTGQIITMCLMTVDTGGVRVKMLRWTFRLPHCATGRAADALWSVGSVSHLQPAVHFRVPGLLKRNTPDWFGLRPRRHG